MRKLSNPVGLEGQPAREAIDRDISRLAEHVNAPMGTVDITSVGMIVRIGAIAVVRRSSASGGTVRLQAVGDQDKGRRCVVYNDSGSLITVRPSSGGSINGADSMDIKASEADMFICISANRWIVIRNT